MLACSEMPAEREGQMYDELGGVWEPVAPLRPEGVAYSDTVVEIASESRSRLVTR